MGACFSSRVTYKDRAEIPEWWTGVQEDCRREFGEDGYNGTFSPLQQSAATLDPGVQFAQINPRANKEAAELYCTDHHEKWDQALAVPFKTKVKQPDAVLRKARLRVVAERARLKNFLKKLLERYQGTKSRTISCPRCGSSISRKYLVLRGPHRERFDPRYSPIYNILCPVCMGFGNPNSILKPNDSARAVAAHDRLHQMDQQIAQLETSEHYKEVNGVAYLVGGWCAE